MHPGVPTAEGVEIGFALADFLRVGDGTEEVDVGVESSRQARGDRQRPFGELRAVERKDDRWIVNGISMSAVASSGETRGPSLIVILRQIVGWRERLHALAVARV